MYLFGETGVGRFKCEKNRMTIERRNSLEIISLKTEVHLRKTLGSVETACT